MGLVGTTTNEESNNTLAVQVFQVASPSNVDPFRIAAGSIYHQLRPFCPLIQGSHYSFEVGPSPAVFAVLKNSNSSSALRFNNLPT
jgi:hypothetical protein